MLSSWNTGPAIAVEGDERANFVESWSKWKLPCPGRYVNRLAKTGGMAVEAAHLERN